jgi:hypothetical protein
MNNTRPNINTRVILSREDGEGSHKCARRHAANPQCSSKARIFLPGPSLRSG